MNKETINTREKKVAGILIIILMPPATNLKILSVTIYIKKVEVSKAMPRCD